MLGHALPFVQGIQLIFTDELPDRFRSIFPFNPFNAVQSKCFDAVFRSDENFVLAAPTGSGKTAILELAICRLVSMVGTQQFKVVYQAPTKALCSERQRDWEVKFGPLDIRCAELTGDTDQMHLRNVQNANIIITTPEKWDSVTRRWRDHVKLMQLVRLFLIDEVHILNETRGATLEAVVSRMKSVGTRVRFVALSATVPNVEDVAQWLGRNASDPEQPALQERLGEEFRPVKLQKYVCGYKANANDFAFDKLCESKYVTPIKGQPALQMNEANGLKTAGGHFKALSQEAYHDILLHSDLCHLRGEISCQLGSGQRPARPILAYSDATADDAE
jgi:ATP-dependent DNA helicase HFM1/MER3